MSGELRALQKRERQLLGMLDSVERFLGRSADERDECEIIVRLQMLEDAAKEFFTVRGKIELILEDAEKEKQANSDPDMKKEALDHLDDENFHIMQEFDDRFCHLKARLLQLQSQGDIVRSTDGSLHDSHRADGLCKVKLPEIRLPTFRGVIREWVTFRDTFKSLIHDNSQLTDTDKFTYLRASLADEALQEINSIDLSAANYIVAWMTLEMRYENKKLIVKTHLDVLFNLEPLKRETYDGLNHILSEFEKNVQMLEKIGENPTEWSTILA
ncbi:uncharacterized protein LOC131680536 [Topomyia yanbarensis]|uniref:uncharacterized protein LOC131680536 n=1 Tax=Topomyia yanbarensis TaxID=2498891 RepID=UPI00273BABBE|nr:uncharacterized protein LOC131680536 [Topomyia yanbarensis]